MSSLSSHLLDSYSMAQQNGRTPFSSFTSRQSQIAYAGPMSYNPGMHGSTSSFLTATPFPALTDPSTLPPDPTFHDISVATHKQIASLQAKLDQKLGPEFVSQRPGPGGGPKLTYAEGWKIINLANEVFGFNGWSSSISSLNIDYLDAHDEGRRWNCNVTAVVRVTLRDGVYHEDVGCGSIENSKSKSMALDKCKKEAVTDALKRTLRNFGNLLGNCLYDKQYTQEIVKIKVQPPKFDRGALYRRPEFEEVRSGNGGKVGPNEGMATSTSKPSKMPPPSLPQQTGKVNNPVHVKSEPGASGAHPIPQQQSNPQIFERTAPAPVPRSGNSSTSSHSSASAKNLPVLPPAHEPCVDPDEASYFHSDDDALLAQLADMDGVGSIVLEEDRPIDYEDENFENTSSMGTNHDQMEPGLSGVFPARHQNSGPPHPSSVPNTDTNDVCGQPTPQKPYHQQPKAQSHAGQQNQQCPPQPQNRAVNQRPPQPQTSSQITQQQPQRQHPHNPQQQCPQHAPQQQHPQQRPQHTQQQQQRLQNQRNHNQQTPQNQPNQTLQNPQNQPIHNQQARPPPQQPRPAQARRPSHPATPSTGGFHFPPGMNTSRPTARLSGPPSSGGPGSAQISGTKRSADAMSSTAPNGSKTHAMNTGTKARAPLAPLEISDGGDVKRIRR